MNEPKPPWKPTTQTQDEVDHTHPGFTITCQRCSSTLVYVENTLGYSPESGGSTPMDDERADRHVIVCNYIEATNVVAKGAKAYVILQLGGNLPENIPVLVRSRGGRWVRKWERTRRLDNYRLKTLPPEHPRYDDDRIWEPYDAEEALRRLRWASAEMRHETEERTDG